MAIEITTTTNEVRAMRELTGDGLMMCKRRILKSRAAAAVEHFRMSGDRETLANILEYLVKDKF